MGCSRDTRTSSERSEPAAALETLELDLPTTAADVAALRRLRGELPPGLHDAASAFPVDVARILASRPTSEGWEPLTL